MAQSGQTRHTWDHVGKTELRRPGRSLVHPRPGAQADPIPQEKCDRQSGGGGQRLGDNR